MWVVTVSHPRSHLLAKVLDFHHWHSFTCLNAYGFAKFIYSLADLCTHIYFWPLGFLASCRSLGILWLRVDAGASGMLFLVSDDEALKSSERSCLPHRAKQGCCVPASSLGPHARINSALLAFVISGDAFTLKWNFTEEHFSWVPTQNPGMGSNKMQGRGAECLTLEDPEFTASYNTVYWVRW